MWFNQNASYIAFSIFSIIWCCNQILDFYIVYGTLYKELQEHSVDILVKKYVITHCIQNQGDVDSTWVFMCLFCLRIYCLRLKGVYCGVDAIMASNLCSMFLIHLQRLHVIGVQLYHFATYNDTPHYYAPYTMIATL